MIQTFIRQFKMYVFTVALDLWHAYCRWSNSVIMHTPIPIQTWNKEGCKSRYRATKIGIKVERCKLNGSRSVNAFCSSV
jgi:hypothetical protein